MTPRLLPWPAAPLGQLRHGPPGRAGARAAWGRHSPPKGPAPAPQEQAQRDAVRGSLEAFREERGAGTSPAGKEVSWVCHSVCRSPDSRPRWLSTNGVCVGADGRHESWRQEPEGEGGRLGSGSRLAGQLNSAGAVQPRCEGPARQRGIRWRVRMQHRACLSQPRSAHFPTALPATTSRVTADRSCSYLAFAHTSGAPRHSL